MKKLLASIVALGFTNSFPAIAQYSDFFNPRTLVPLNSVNTFFLIPESIEELEPGGMMVDTVSRPLADGSRVGSTIVVACIQGVARASLDYAISPQGEVVSMQEAKGAVLALTQTEEMRTIKRWVCDR